VYNKGIEIRAETAQLLSAFDALQKTPETSEAPPTPPPVAVHLLSDECRIAASQYILPRTMMNNLFKIMTPGQHESDDFGNAENTCKIMELVLQYQGDPLRGATTLNKELVQLVNTYLPHKKGQF
jgi:hypothetical protein